MAGSNQPSDTGDNGYLGPLLKGSKGTGNRFLGPLLGGGGVPPPPLDDMFEWYISDVATTEDGFNGLILWGDQSPRVGHALPVISPRTLGPPTVVPAVRNGRQGVLFQQTGGIRLMEDNAPAVNIAPTDPVTTYTVCIPTTPTAGFLFQTNGDGATVPPARVFCIVTLGGIQYGYTDYNFHDGVISPPVVDYSGQAILVVHYSQPAIPSPNIWMSVDQVDRPIVPPTMQVAGLINVGGFFIGGVWMTGGLFSAGFDGYILEQISYRANLRGTPKNALVESYLINSWTL